MPLAVCLALISALAGIGCLVSLPAVYEVQRQRLEAAEPYYASPIPLLSGTLRLRHDRIGKGYFSASRSGGRRHKGLDLTAVPGTAVLAAKSGRVTISSLDENGYGLWIEILHPDGLVTRYAHLSSSRVRRGDWVRRGQLVGLSGKTGNADDPRIIPHLHFEIRFRRFALNPQDKLLDPSVQIR